MQYISLNTAIKLVSHYSYQNTTWGTNLNMVSPYFYGSIMLNREPLIYDIES